MNTSSPAAPSPRMRSGVGPGQQHGIRMIGGMRMDLGPEDDFIAENLNGNGWISRPARY